MILLAFALLTVALSTGLKYETKALDFNTVYSENLQGSEMKFYSIPIDSNLKQSDLLIDARISSKNRDLLFKSPLVLVSLKPLPNTDKSSQWVCGQLGLETCFVPNKYLSAGSKVYIGVLCEKCDYSLRASYVQEELLKDGENKLFHLKAGDKKVFQLDEFFQAEKDWIQISAFNLRMKKFTMQVEILEKQNPKNVIEAPVSLNWIGGQQAIIKPQSQFTSKYSYRVILSAVEDGVFDIEARTSKSLIKLEDKSLKFDTVKKNQGICYSYKATTNTDKLILEVKSIKGDVKFNITPESTGTKQTLKVEDGNDIKTPLTSDNLLICAESVSDNAFFTVQIYQEANSSKVREYKQLLYSLLKKEEMYDLENIQISQPEMRKLENLPPFRILTQTDNQTTIGSDVAAPTTDNTMTGTSSGTTTQPPAESDVVSPNNNQNVITSADNNSTTASGISINGKGVAGISVFIIFLIPVLIGSFALMSIFVNTKFLDQPIRIKIMD